MNQQQLQEAISAQLRLDHLSAEEQQAIIADLGQLIMERITGMIMGKLDKEDMAIFQTLLTEVGFEKAYTYVLGKIPNIKNEVDVIVQEEVKALQQI
jgi:hypothetical protein